MSLLLQKPNSQGEHAEMKRKPPHKGMDLEITETEGHCLAWHSWNSAPFFLTKWGWLSCSSLGGLRTTSAFKAPLTFCFLLYTRAWGRFFFAPSFSWVITATCQTRYFLYTPTHQTAWAFAVPSFFFLPEEPWFSWKTYHDVRWVIPGSLLLKTLKHRVRPALCSHGSLCTLRAFAPLCHYIVISVCGLASPLPRPHSETMTAWDLR